MITRRKFLVLTAGGAAGAALAQQQRHEHPPTFEQIAAALEAKPGASIADVGAGHGAYTFRLAPIVGSEGRIWAVEISRSAIRQLRRKITEGNVTNVEVVEGKPDDPLLPEGKFDAVLVADAYHEMEERVSMLQRMRAALKPGGRLVIVEHMPSKALLAKPRDHQQDSHSLAPEHLQADLESGGFDIVQTKIESAGESDQGHDHGSRYMIIARKRGSSF